MKWVVSSSTVIVATREGDTVYESIEDCPEPLRSKIEKTLDGPDSVKKIITNRNAFERMMQSVHELPAAVREVANDIEPAPEPAPLPPWYMIAGGLLAVAAALFGLLLWAIKAA
jgi:hypothetical protein